MYYLKQELPKEGNFSNLEGAKISKGTKEGQFEILWRWTCTRYSRVAEKEQKKNFLGVYIFETYTRYSEVADEKRS